MYTAEYNLISLSFTTLLQMTLKDVYENKINLNILGTVKFAKNICEFLSKQDVNSGNISLGNKKGSTALEVSNSRCVKSVRMRSFI